MLTENQTLNELEGAMPDYTVLVPDLAKRLGLSAMDLVRDCRIAVNTAYSALKGDVNLDTCWKIYAGLVSEGYELDGRPIQWSDVVDFGEFRAR